MKRKILSIIIIVLLLVRPAVGVVNLGTKKANEFIGYDLICIDSAGIDAKPDSAHIFTRIDAGTAIQFKTRSTTFPFDAIGIDTAKEYGDTLWSFSDQIQDIDGTPTPPTYTLSIDAVLWNSKIATHNRAIVQVIADSLNEATAGSIASLKPTVAGRTLDVASTGEGGVDLSNVNGTLDAGEIGTDAITATKIATDAIGASELAANAIGSSEIGDGAFDSLAYDATFWEKLAGVSDSGATGSSPWSSAQRDSLLNTVLDANKGNYKATGFSTHSQSDVWAVATKVITGTSADAITATSIAANAIGASEIADDAFDSLALDVTFWEKLANVSDSGATGSSPWSSGQRDSLLAAVADANMDDKLTKIFSTTQRDSLLDALADANLFDKMTGFDSLRFTADFWKKLAGVSDSGAAGSSSPWNTVEKDSVLAALSDANMGDKIPLGGGASPWTVAQRDSLLNVATDAVFRDKVLGDSLTSPATLERLLIDGGSLLGHDGFSRTFTFVDSANSNAPINQLPVFANNEAQTMLQPYNGLTDNNGQITFNLPAGTWTIYHSSELWVMYLDTIVVSGSASQSINLYSDLAANHAVVLGYIGGVGQFPNGIVDVTLAAYDPSVELQVGDTLYGQNTKSYSADASGKFEVPLIQTDIFGTDSAYYKFTFKTSAGRRVRVGGQRQIFVKIDTTDVTAGVANFNSLTRVDPQ